MTSKRSNRPFGGTGHVPELLAPCGSYEALTAAVSAGADAVYFGGTLLNARMHARNFDRDELSDAVAYCHGNGVRAYVTMNTQIYDREMKKALDYAAFLYDAGVDALILADRGLASLIRRYFPDMALHASTQMTAHNSEAVSRLASDGFSRVVVAREISRDNLASICRSDTEIELFVHGAVCVSCSGQCLMSAMLGGRSGNRGECAQPCRMSYNGTYPISLKDMCLASHLKEICQCGVSSLKIEGRMKNPDYVAGVTAVYRRLLDEGHDADERDIKKLSELFSRSGFTDGYFTGKIDNTMLGIRSQKDIADTRRAVPPSKSRSVPRPSVPIAARQAGGGAEPLPEKLPYPQQKRAMMKPIVTARFARASQIPDSHDFTHLYLPLAEYRSAADGVLIPPVIFDSERDDIKRLISLAVKAGARHAMVRNIGQIDLVREFGLIPHGDFRLNIFNGFSAVKWAETPDCHFESLLLSTELTLPQIRDIYLPEGIAKGAVVYGRIPMMLLEKPIGSMALRDTRGALFPVMKEGKRDILLNSVPLYMADQETRLDGAGIEERHMLFTTENKGDVMRILYAYQHHIPSKEPIRRLK